MDVATEEAYSSRLSKSENEGKFKDVLNGKITFDNKSSSVNAKSILHDDLISPFKMLSSVSGVRRCDLDKLNDPKTCPWHETTKWGELMNLRETFCPYYRTFVERCWLSYICVLRRTFTNEREIR